MKFMIKYYHMDGGDTLESLVDKDALESFVRVLLSTGYRIIEIV